MHDDDRVYTIGLPVPGTGMYTIRLGSDERKGLNVPLGICKILFICVCVVWLSLVFVILDSCPS